MDTPRKDLLDKKKKQAGEILSSRKRKLSNLFYLSLYPNYPVTEAQLDEHRADLDAFLSLTDLEVGKNFAESFLPEPLTELVDSVGVSDEREHEHESRGPEDLGDDGHVVKKQKIQMGSSKRTKSQSPGADQPKNVDQNEDGNENKHENERKNENETEKNVTLKVNDKLSAGSSDLQKNDIQKDTSNVASKDAPEDAPEDTPEDTQSPQKDTPKVSEKSSEQSSENPAIGTKLDKPKKTVTIAEPETHPPKTVTVSRPKAVSKPRPKSSSSSSSGSSKHPIRIPNRQNPRSFTYPDDKDSELMLFVVPDRLPEPPQSRRPLSELYYTTQTLPLINLLPAAHKTLTTDNYQLSLLEGKLSVVHSRIEELKRLDKWSLRQVVKNKGPYRAKTHWDHLMDEAKWLREDVREERKLKIALAYELSNAVKDYWTLGKEVCSVTYKRKHCPIQEIEEDAEGATVGPEAPNEQDVSMDEVDNVGGESPAEDKETSEDAKQSSESAEIEFVEAGTEAKTNEGSEEMSDSKPKDVPKDDSEDSSQAVVVAVGDETKINGLKSAVPEQEVSQSVDPSAVMSQPSEEDTNSTHYSHLNSLVPLKVSEDIWNTSHFETVFKTIIDPDQLNSVSKELFSNLAYISAFSPNTPYVNEFDNLSLTSVTNFLSAPDLERGWQRVVLDKISTDRAFNRRLNSEKQEPKQTLFGSESRRRYISIKAPKPPNIKYLEYRTPTIWLPLDDNKLMKLVKEFSYNWDIVALHMLPQPTNGYVSNIERRTPWQCFERWHQLTPSFQLSDLKGPYANAAQVWLDSAVKAQAITKRRISPLGVGPESIQRGNKRLRWASMFDAIRKSMRKRENAPRPNNTVQRKSQLSDSKTNIPTPIELSKMKWERDKSIAEAYQQQQQRIQMELAVRNRSSGSSINARGGPSSTAVPVQGSAGSGGGGSTASVPSTSASTMASRPISGGVNANANSAPVSRAGGGSTNVTSAGMPASSIPAGQRPSQEQLDQMMRAEKRRQLLRQQAAAAAASSGNSSGATGAVGGSVGSNGSSVSSTPRAATPSGMTPAQRQQHQATVSTVLAMLQQSLNGIGNSQHLVTLASQITAQHPTLPAEQIAKIAHAQIQRYRVQLQQKQQQAAAAAAAAGGGAGAGNSARSSAGSEGGVPVNNMSGGISTAQAQALLQRQAGQGVRLTSQQQQQQVMAQVLRAQQQQMLQKQGQAQAAQNQSQPQSQGQSRMSSSSPSPSGMQFPH